MNWYLQSVPPREKIRHQEEEMSYEDGGVRLGMCFALRDMLGSVAVAPSWKCRCDAALDVVLMSYVAGVPFAELKQLITDWAILILDEVHAVGDVRQDALFNRHRLAVYMALFPLDLPINIGTLFVDCPNSIEPGYEDVALETELLGRMLNGEPASSIRQRDWAGITEFGRLLLVGDQSGLSSLLVTEMRSCRRRGVALARGHSKSVVGRTRGFRDHGHCLDAICLYRAAGRWGLSMEELPADLRCLSVDTEVGASGR